MGKISGTKAAELLCIDLKTVHNWVNSGRLRATRTKGRHLRFDEKYIMGIVEDIDPHNLYTVPQLAYMYGVSNPTIYSWIEKEKIPCHAFPFVQKRIHKKYLERFNHYADKLKLCKGMRTPRHASRSSPPLE